MSFAQREDVALKSIIANLRYTDFGRKWPSEYEHLYKLWGYFNQIYDLLYPEQKEWQRIASFSLDQRFSSVLEQRLRRTMAVRCLAFYPCVGDGRKGFEPQEHVRVAFHTLREIFGVSISEVCSNGSFCSRRKERGWQLCLNYSWPSPPQNIVRDVDAKFTLVGSVLTIAYQVRNNLFHGSKIQRSERDVKLVGLVVEIVHVILEAFIHVYPRLS